MLNILTLKQYAIEGTPEEQRVARGILRYDQKKRKFMSPIKTRANYVQGRVLPQIFNDYTTREQRMNFRKSKLLKVYETAKQLLGVMVVMFIGWILAVAILSI